MDAFLNAVLSNVVAGAVLLLVGLLGRRVLSLIPKWRDKLLLARLTELESLRLTDYRWKQVGNAGIKAVRLFTTWMILLMVFPMLSSSAIPLKLPTMDMIPSLLVIGFLGFVVGAYSSMLIEHLRDLSLVDRHREIERLRLKLGRDVQAPYVGSTEVPVVHAFPGRVLGRQTVEVPEANETGA